MSISSDPTGVVPAAIQSSGTGGTTFFNGGGSSSAPSSASTSPLLSQDLSGFSQWSLSQISSNPVNLQGLPGSLAAATTIGQALQDFMDLPPAQLQQLQMQLWDAGFYVNQDGSPVSAADIHFGSPGDPASWTAFARALSEASGSNISLNSILQGRTQMGAGQSNLLPSPATGGGHTYTIDLSNPTEVKYVADTIFQSALGRNANASEVSDITSKLQSQETSQGMAQESGAEQQSRSQYQAQVNQNRIAYENATNPNINGQIPSGPFDNPQSWATALLSYMNMPVSTSNVAAITAWMDKVGKFSDGSFNPLDTSRPEGGSTTSSSGSQNFQNWAQGLQATASMLMNGKYSALTQALQNGVGADAVKSDPTVRQELNTWSDGSYSSLTVTSQQTQAAAQAAFYYGVNQQQQQPQQAQAAPINAPSGLPMGMSANNAQMIGATPQVTPPGAQPAPAAAAQPGAAPATVSPYNASSGQQPPNPGDVYINPVTVSTVNPASEQAQAYQEATTGANKIPYMGNEYLNAYNAILSMVKGGGVTSG